MQTKDLSCREHWEEKKSQIKHKGLPNIREE